MKNPLKQIMGVQEAGTTWGLSPDRVKGLCQENKVAAVKIGKTWVLDKNQDNPKGGSKMKNGIENVGTWWNDESIELVKINKRVFALNGWNGEDFTECWECMGKDHAETSGKTYELTPVYNKRNEIINYVIG